MSEPMSALEKYQELARRRLALQEEDDKLLGEMDKVWLALSPAEMDQVDPGGKEFREKARKAKEKP